MFVLRSGGHDGLALLESRRGAHTRHGQSIVVIPVQVVVVVVPTTTPEHFEVVVDGFAAALSAVTVSTVLRRTHSHDHYLGVAVSVYVGGVFKVA